MSQKWWPLVFAGLVFLPGQTAGQEKSEKKRSSTLTIADLERILADEVQRQIEKPTPRFIPIEFDDPIVVGWQPPIEKPTPRSIPLEFDGDPEAFLEEHLGLAREVRKLLQDIEVDAKRLDFDSVRRRFEQLGKKSPEIRKLLKDAGVDKILAKGKDQKPPTKEEAKKLQKAVEQALVKVKETPAPAVTPPSTKGVDPPTPPPPSLDERARDFLRDLLEDAQDASWFRELLQDSPGLEDALSDLLRSLEAGEGEEAWLRDLTMPLDVWDRLSSFDLPGLPEVSLPVPEFGGGHASVPPVPATGVPSTATLVGLAVVLVLLLSVWSWARAKGRARSARGAWQLGPWPVLPQNVSTREQFLQAFEYLALLLVGAEARASNHRAIAERLNAQQPKRQDAVNELAALYEQVRYAPGHNLTDEALASARRNLCLLAGVPS